MILCIKFYAGRSDIIKSWLNQRLKAEPDSGLYGEKKLRFQYRFRTFTCVLTALSATTFAMAAWPQTTVSTSATSTASDSEILTEIVVTARRRAEDVQQIPVEVSVVSTPDIHALNVLTEGGIGNLVSGLQADPAPGSANAPTFSIRGQSGATGVVTYMSEVPNFSAKIFDLQNVQVLKGPQGTLFGDVTTGGAILLQPVMPSNEFEGFADVRLGSHYEHDVEFGIGGPIIADTLSFRISGITHNSNGYSHDIYNDTTGDGTDNQALRAIIKLDVGPVENVTLAQYENDADQARLPIPLLAVPTLANSQPIPAPIAALAGIRCAPACPTWISVMQQELAAQAGLGPYSSNVNDFGTNPVGQQWGVINTTNYQATDWLTVRNILSYREERTTSPGDNEQDGYSLPITDLITLAGSPARTTTEEVQVQAKPLDSLHLAAGYYYEHDWNPTYGIGAAASFGGYAGPLNTGYISLASKIDDFSKGTYFQADWKILPRLTLTGGVRYTQIDNSTWTAPTSLAYTSLGMQLPFNVLPTRLVTIPGVPPNLALGSTNYLPGIAQQELLGHKVTYTGALDYLLTDDVNLYVTTRTGYKPGNFNQTPPTPAFAEYQPENVTDWEGGIKTRWKLGGVSGITNLAIYTDSYNNIQREFTVTNPSTGLPAAIVSNVAAATIRGADLDFGFQFSPAFDLSGYWSYTDAFYTKFPNTGQFGPGTSNIDLTQMLLSDVSKNRVGLRPAVHLQGLAGEDLPDVVFSANAYYKSRYADQNTNGVLSPISIVPGRTLADLRTEWFHVGGGHLNVALGVINVGNNQSLLVTNDQTMTSGYAYGYYQSPRTYYLELHYDWK
jgi:iron complex outermembrane receptor protein